MEQRCGANLRIGVMVYSDEKRTFSEAIKSGMTEAANIISEDCIKGNFISVSQSSSFS
ncbi:hypothetical protein D3C73_1601570 [compost metagenome]